MALTDKLTAIADAIRGKTGKTEEMTLDQMATEIGEIEAGGGALPDGVSNMTYGEFIPASDVSTMTIEHGLGEKPHIVALWATGEMKPAQFALCIVGQTQSIPSSTSVGGQSSILSVALDGAGTSFWGTNDYTTRGGISSADDTSFAFAQGTTEKYLTAGTTYCWFAIALDAVGGL